MHCRNCGAEVNEKAIACPGCGVAPGKESKFCHACGVETNANQMICVKCGVALGAAAGSQGGDKSKVTAGLLGILLGSLGIHKFYLGYNVSGIIMLLISLVLAFPTAGLSAGIMSIIGLIEGIVYLTKSDADFDASYVQNKKSWF